MESDSDSDETESDTEETTEPEEQVVPKSEVENSSSESAGANGVTNSDASSVNLAINSTGITVENAVKCQFLKPHTAIITRPAVAGVLQSDAVPARLAREKVCAASFRSAIHKTATLTSSAGGHGVRTNMASAGAFTSSCSLGSQKPVTVSLASQFSKSSVCEPRTRSAIQSSVAQVNSVRLTTWTSSSVKSRRVVTTFCGRNFMSSSTTQEPVEPALCAAVKVEPESSNELVESDFTEPLTQSELNEQSILSRTFTVSAGDKSSARLLGKASGLSSANTRCNSTSSATAAGPCVSGPLTSPHVNNSVASSVTVAGPCASGALINRGVKNKSVTNSTMPAGPPVYEPLTNPVSCKSVASSVLAAKPCISKALINHGVSTPVTAVGPCVSEPSTNQVMSKSSRWSSIDVKPSLGKSVVIADLASPITNEKRSSRHVAPANQRDIVQVCHRLRQMRYRDASPRLPSTQVESACFQRQAAVSKLASGMATKTVSAFAGRSVMSTACTVSSVADYHPAESRGADPKCLKVTCSNRPTNATPCEPIPWEVSTSAEVTESGKISACCTVTTARRGHCASAVGNVFEASSGENSQSRSSHIDSNNNRTGNRCVSETRLANVTVDGNKLDQNSSQSRFGRFATSTLRPDGSPSPVYRCTSDTILASLVTENSKVDQKSSQRRFHGFATSTPLRDSSPPPDMSFSSLSTISLASDHEEYDTADDIDDISESDDDVVLLDIAFNSDSDSAPSCSETYVSAVQLKPSDLFRKTDSSALCESTYCPSHKSLEFLPRTNNCITSRSCGYSNSCCPVKPMNAKLSNEVGPVVRHVSTKRTREILSSSSDSDDGMLKTRHSPRTLRNTRARLSRGVERKQHRL